MLSKKDEKEIEMLNNNIKDYVKAELNTRLNINDYEKKRDKINFWGIGKFFNKDAYDTYSIIIESYNTLLKECINEQYNISYKIQQIRIKAFDKKARQHLKSRKV